MPTEGNAGELESILAQAEAEPGGQPSQDFRQDAGQGDMLTKTSQPKPGEESQTLLAGKYKTPQELEKGYLNLNRLSGQTLSRSKQLEALIQNPRFQEMAARDPEMRAALGKLGYELRQEEDREERESETWDGNTNDPRYLIALSDARNELRWEMFTFSQERGKPLSQEEEKAVRQVIALSPQLSVKQAYRLTPHFERDLKENEDKRVSEATRKAQPNRPKPNATLLPGQKLNLQKPVVEMNDAEKKAYLAKLVEENP